MINIKMVNGLLMVMVVEMLWYHNWKMLTGLC